jgi:hypothetical protein
MTHSTINGAVIEPIVLGSGAYGTKLTITATGSVYPGDGGAAAITGLAGVAGVVIQNAGSIAGGNANNSATHAGGAGILLNNGGTIRNSGIIDGGTGIVHAYNGYAGGNGIDTTSGTIRNSGTISGGSGGTGYGQSSTGGTGGIGVDLSGSGMIVNRGEILGGNGGTSEGTQGVGPDGGAGIYIASGSVLNRAGATISGGRAGAGFRLNGEPGVGIIAANATAITNAGTITGGAAGYGSSSGFGINFLAAGTLSNSGVIRGTGYGSDGVIGGSITLKNSGTISSTEFGCYGLKLAEGSVVNTGIILGGYGENSAGIFLGAGTLDAKAGLIGVRGFGDAVLFGDNGPGTLVISPSAQFEGNIVGNAAAADVLDLARGQTAGILSGLGSSVSGFSTIAVDNNATWQLDGTLAGNEAVNIGSHATLQFYGAATVPTISFAARGDATLLLGNPTEVTSTFNGFGSGDQIDLLGITATSLSYNAGTLTLLGADSQIVDTLHFNGDYTQSDFSLQALGNGTAVAYAGTEPRTLTEIAQVNHLAGFTHVWL